MKVSFNTIATVILAVCLSVTNTHAVKVIANWDIIPGQTFAEPFKAGVVAFHETGVEVEFTVNGNAITVTEPTYNDRTDVWEYWTELDPSALGDGEVTLSAVCSPDGAGHESKSLDAITLYANSGGTYDVDDVMWVDPVDGNDVTGDGSEASPYQTIPAALENITSGGTVYLKAGTYGPMLQSGPRSHDRWTTITPAPGVAREAVIIDSDDQITHNYTKWVNVTFTTSQRTGLNSYIIGFLLDNNCWVDNADIFHGGGPGGGGGVFKGQANRTLRTYCTNSYVHSLTNASPGKFSRNIVIDSVGADIWRAGNDLFAVNTKINSMTPVSGAHPDLIQFYNPDAPVDNIIIYNMEAHEMNAQGIFGSGDNYGTNVAFVNWLMHKTNSAAYSSQFGDHQNMLLWHFTTVGNSFLNNSPLVESSVKNNIFESFSNDSPVAFFDYNHFQRTVPFGSNATMGPARYANEIEADFSLLESSPAYHAGAALECVPADINGTPYDAVSPNLGCFASGTGAAVATVVIDGNGGETGTLSWYDVLQRYADTPALVRVYDARGNGIVPGSDVALGMYVYTIDGETGVCFKAD